MSKDETTQEKFEYTIGGKLERNRIKKKWTIEQVSSKICVSEKYLIAIEQGDFKNLPENAFTIGFIRSYADLVGINADPLVAEFKQCISGAKETIEPTYKTYETSQKPAGKKYIYVSVFLLIIIMLWIVVTSVINVDDNEKIQTTQTEQTQSTTTNTETEAEEQESQNTETNNETSDDLSNDLNNDDLESQETQTETEQTTNEIATVEPTEATKAKFIAVDNVVISIYKPDGSYYLQDKELNKGRYVTAPLNKGYKIQASNGGLITITIDGLYDYKVMGEDGIVMDRVEINIDELAKHFN